jgi:ATP-dependent Clp protease ATP-binding subunit ClpB
MKLHFHADGRYAHLNPKIDRLHGLRVYMRENIIGQDTALEKVYSILRNGELGLNAGSRPRGSFLFLGPTGVGKTELTLTFSYYLFGKNKLFRFDMSEFMHFDYVKEFRGDETGSGGRLGRCLDGAGEGVLLFDEMEKAHKLILDLFLQILDTATITLGNGRVYDLANYYIVMTSNVGAYKIMHTRKSGQTTIHDSVMRELHRQNFRPEFLARFDDIIVFNKLESGVQATIANLALDRELRRLKEKNNITLLYQPGGPVLHYLCRNGINIEKGARPLKMFTARTVQNAITEKLMAYEDPNGYLLYDSVKQKIYIENRREFFPGAEDYLGGEEKVV